MEAHEKLDMTGGIGTGHREPIRSNATVPRGSRDREIAREGDLKGLHLSTGSQVRGQETQQKDRKKTEKRRTRGEERSRRKQEGKWGAGGRSQV